MTFREAQEIALVNSGVPKTIAEKIIRIGDQVTPMGASTSHFKIKDGREAYVIEQLTRALHGDASPDEIGDVWENEHAIPTQN